MWTPSFSLPAVNSPLLQITDKKTLMKDQDLGEMFLLFQLHPNMTKFTAVDLGPLPWSVHIAGCVGHVISWDSSPCLITPSGCIWCWKRSSKEVATIQTTPSNGIPFSSTCLGQRDTSRLYLGYPSAGMMDLWPVTLYVLLMTFRSQDKDVGESGKLAMPSACDKVIWDRTLYGSSDWQMGHNGWELGLR
jgi:hypothetical protein